MPSIPVPSRADMLERMKLDELKDCIDTLNAAGHAITTTGRKALLIRRITRAENPASIATPPVLSAETLQSIDTQMALAAVVKVTSEVTKANAASVLSSLNALAREVHDLCDENIENWKAQKKMARKGELGAIALEAKLLGPIPATIETIKTSIAGYELAKDNEREEERASLAEYAANMVRDSKLSRIIALEDAGDFDAAIEVEATLDDTSTAEVMGSLPTVAPTKVAGASTSFNYRWKVLDMGRIGERFIRVVINTSEVDEVVKKHGIAAKDIIGDGIHIYKEAVTRSTGR